MRIRPLSLGVDGVSRLSEADEVHLPEGTMVAEVFLPETSLLSDILARPTLDERLPELLVPDHLPAELLRPSVLAETRRTMVHWLMDQAQKNPADPVFQEAAEDLERDCAIDADISAALALLLSA